MRMPGLLFVVSAACTPPAEKDDTRPAPVGDTGPVDSGDTDAVTTVENGTFVVPPYAVLPLGDSITEGCYRYDLWTRMVDAGWSFDFVGSMRAEPLLNGAPHAWPEHAGRAMDPDHDGHSGWTSGHILTTPGTWDTDRGTLTDWLAGYTPDAALVHLGTNDAFYEHDATTLVASLDAIVAALREDNPRVRIHLARIIPLVHPYWGGGTYDPIVRGYNEAISAFALSATTTDSPIRVVDQYTGFDGATDTYDLIHPNASGDAKVAARWMQSLVADSAPVGVPDRHAINTTRLDVAREAGLLANDRSLVGALRASIVTPPAHGRLTLYTDGAFVYEGDGTPDQFTYAASDGALSSEPTVVDVCAGAGCVPEPPAGVYVDCLAGDDDADGRSPETAWASLDRLAAEPLAAGAAVWFVAGTRCAGTLRLDGSGTEAAPITVGAWGDGPAPEVVGVGEAAVYLRDQSWITLEGLDVHGSTRWGIYVGASTQVAGITLRGLEVHDVQGGAPDAKATGLVVFTIDGAAGWFEQIRVDDVYAHDTDQWSGIFLHGTLWRQDGPRSRDIVFSNNVVHDVGGDGVVVFGAEDALLDANLAYEVGLTPLDDVGTPNGIWTWDCHRCTVQFNEAHHVHSPGVDGGAFDIDYDNVDNVVQYNYGHHNDAYCIAVFGAEGTTTTGSVVRHNVCVNNGLAADTAYMGDIFTYTWNGGSLGDVQIYNNTVVRAEGYPPLVLWAELGAGSGVWNNLFVTDHDWMATVAGRPPMSNNLWWTTAGGSAWFDDNAATWVDGVAAWQAVAGGSDNLQANPLLEGGASKAAARLTGGSPAIDAGAVLPDPGACDAFGNLLAGTPEIGAHAWDATPDATCGR